MSIWITFKYEYVHFLGESHANFKRFWKRSRTQQRPTFLILQTRKLRPQEGSAWELMVLLKARTLMQITWKQFCCLFYLGLLQTTCCQILDQTLNLKFFENVLHLLTKRQTHCSKKILSLQPWTIHLSRSIILQRFIQAEMFKWTYTHTHTQTHRCSHTHALFQVCPWGTASHTWQKKEDTNENGELFVLAERTGPVFPVRLTIILPPAVQFSDSDCDLYLPGYGVHITD